MMADPFVLGKDTHYELQKISTPKNGKMAGISTRNGGFSTSPFQTLNLGLHVGDSPEKVVLNRQKLAKNIGIPLKHWVFAEQVHGSLIHKVTSRDKGKGSRSSNTGIMGVDGLYTNETNVVLALAFADCVPLFFTSSTQKLVGIAHAGWKGTVQRIGPRMVETWKKMAQVSTEDIQVVIGPSIGSCCYVVDDRVISRVDPLLQSSGPIPYTRNKDGTYQLNLQQLNRQLLIQEGIPPKHIQISKKCTGCQRTDFFSHRKENGKTGRMLGYIAIHE